LCQRNNEGFLEVINESTSYNGYPQQIFRINKKKGVKMSEIFQCLVTMKEKEVSG